ncbi:hypothetical protein MRS44_007125 [Fusarium solani]|nr:hypothetical protein MRS44_007125 [Fusarium solani]
MIELIWRPPRKERGVKRQHIDRTLPENFKYYGHWGYTIYRTHYSPESDEHWDMLLDALKRQTYLALGYLGTDKMYEYEVSEEGWERPYRENRDAYMKDLERVKKLFHLDLREDSSLLNGLDVRQLREVCLDEHPKAEKTMAGGMFHFVLVADESVLKDIARGEFVVKAVAYDWEENGEYWGRMRVPTGYLLELWHALMMSPFNHHRVLRFDGPEEDLEEYIWAGYSAANPTSNASEVRPGCLHYSAQRPEFGVERR